MPDWFPDCDCDCDPTQVGCDDQQDIDPGDVTDPGAGGDPGVDPPGGDADIDPDPPGGTEEDPGTQPPGGGSEGGGGGGGGSQPPPDTGQTSCDSEPGLTGVSNSTSDAQITLGDPQTIKIGSGISATNGGVVKIASPVIIGMNQYGAESRTSGMIEIDGAVIRGSQYGLIASNNGTIKAGLSTVCRTGAVHAEHAGVMLTGRSLFKNNRRNIAADASFWYVVKTTFETTRFRLTNLDRDKAYGLLSLSHVRGELNSTIEAPSSKIRGDLGASNVVLDTSSVIESQPEVID